MLGWERLAAVRPSRLKRVPISVSAYPGLSSLTAIGRSSTSSRPKNTVDIPPEPISRSRTNLSVSLITRVIIKGSSGECYGRGRGAALREPIRDGSEELDALVLQPVELPPRALDNANPGPREELRSPGVVEPNLERYLCRVTRDRGRRVRSELHVGERVNVLLLRPLANGTNLALEPLREVRPGLFGPGEGHLVVHVEDRLLGLARGKGGLGVRLAGGSVASGCVLTTCVSTIRVVGPPGRGRAGSLPLRLGDACDRSGHPASGVRTDQRHDAGRDDEQQEEPDHGGGQRPPLPRTCPEGPRRDVDCNVGRPGELRRPPTQPPPNGLEARSTRGPGGSCGARQPRDPSGPDRGGGRRHADVAQPLVQRGRVGAIGGVFGEAAEDEGFEALA